MTTTDKIVSFPEREYLVNEAQILVLCMLTPSAESPKVADVRRDIVAIVKAWRRGELLPASAAPALVGLLQDLGLSIAPPSPPAA